MVARRPITRGLSAEKWRVFRYSTSAFAYSPASKYLSARFKWRAALALGEHPEVSARRSKRQKAKRQERGKARPGSVLPGRTNEASHTARDLMCIGSSQDTVRLPERL